MTGAVRAAALCLAWLALCAGEPLVCRGFTAADAVTAAGAHSGRGFALAGPDAGRRIWFSLADRRPQAAAAAIAHALGCWWSDGDPIVIGSGARLPPGRLEVRGLPGFPGSTPTLEGPLRRLLAPWLQGGASLACDALDGSWSATLPADGHARLAAILTAIGDRRAEAPHLLPTSLPRTPLARSPGGADLAAWCLDLARLAGITVSLGPAADPGAKAPGSAGSVADAVGRLAAQGLATAWIDGCLLVGGAAGGSPQHPAQRAVIARVPVGHLAGDAPQTAVLAAQLEASDRATWDRPGWGVVAVPGRSDLLVIGDAAAIHAALAWLERAERRPPDAGR